MSDVLNVKFFTVDNQIQDVVCDSARLPVSDSIKGAFSGFYGIKKGHARAILSLKAGKVTLSSNEKIILEADISEGFATVENNIVSIIVDSIDLK